MTAKISTFHGEGIEKVDTIMDLPEVRTAIEVDDGALECSECTDPTWVEEPTMDYPSTGLKEPN